MGDRNLDPGLQLIRAERGLASRVAESLGLGRNTVSQWRTIPEHHVKDVSRITGIPVCRLRPDLFPPREIQPRKDKRRKTVGGTKRGGRYGH